MTALLAFLGALVLVAVLSPRGSDHALLAGLNTGGFAWNPAFPMAILTGALTGAAAAWLGAQAANLAPTAGPWFGAVGGTAALWRALTPRKPVTLREPTRSVFALALVLAILQSLDAVRLAVFALAALTREPWLVVCGAALGMPIGLARSAHPATIDDG